VVYLSDLIFWLNTVVLAVYGGGWEGAEIGQEKKCQKCHSNQEEHFRSMLVSPYVRGGREIETGKK
jgi:hypothetical protein